MQRTVVAVIATLLCLTACDVDLFGLDRKRLEGGYSLVLTEVDNACALVPPHQNGGAVVVEVGCQRPLILTRRRIPDLARYRYNDTKRATISDEQRKTDTA